MTYYPDLSRGIGIRGVLDNQLTMIGWLEPDHGYTQGSVQPAVLEKLMAICRTRHLVGMSIGYHECSFCGTSGWYYDSELCKNLGNHNYVVPGVGDTVYYFPDLIVHYIRDHSYAPPTEFCTALLRCPAPDSAEYLARIERYLARRRP